VETLLADFDFAGKLTFAAQNLDSAMHPGQSASIYLDDQRIGLIGRLHPAFEQAQGLPQTFIFELNLEPLFGAERGDKTAIPAPKFPSVTRDIALLVGDAVSSQQVEDIIWANAGKYLVDVTVFDLYQGPKLPAHSKSLAYTLTYLNREDTLTEDVVEKAFAKVKAQLEEKLNAVIR
jgi:phenylalanyl-tRNA synthetase beta chain